MDSTGVIKSETQLPLGFHSVSAPFPLRFRSVSTPFPLRFRRDHIANDSNVYRETTDNHR